MSLSNDIEYLNEFSKLHLRAYNEGTYYTLIHDNINYEVLFKNAPSLEAIYNIFINGFKVESGEILKLPSDDIVGFYLINGHEILSQEDVNFISRSFGTTDNEKIGKYIADVKAKVTAMKQYSLSIGATINMYLSQIETYQPVDYEIIENNEEKSFSLTINNPDSSVRPVNEGDTLEIFDILEPSIRYPVIIYSNPNSECRFKCSNHNPVSFDANHLIKTVFPPNSITIVYKSGEMITLDFELASTNITINSNKIDDDKVKKVTNFISMINFEEENKTKKVSGKIVFYVDKVIGYYSLFEWLITDPIASILFYVDETARAWCSKDIFYVFFRDFSTEMINGTDIKTSDSYFRFSIPTQKKESISGFTIGFNSKSKDMIPSFIYKFSRLLTQFLSLGVIDDSNRIAIRNKKVKIYSKTGKALEGQAPEYFKHESKSRDETGTVTTGNYYSRTCQAKIQPIIIQDDEVDYWRAYGREPVLFPPPEWGFKKSYWFVCPKNSCPKVSSRSNKQDESGKIPYLPCCLETGKSKSKSDVDVNVSSVARTGISEMISTLGGNYGTLNDALSTFLSISFFKEGGYLFQKQGTILDDQPITYLNSAIIALLIATVKQVNPNKPLNLLNIADITENVNIVRGLMARLSPDIYRQELYDMTDEEIIESILDPKTFIDPYLYFRGLEIIFDIQIFTFTSNIGRKNPLSDEEDVLPISSLEVPRCKYTHIRHDNKKEIVCLYKNYGSTSKINLIPTCELIVCVDKSGRPVAKKVSEVISSYFFESLFNLLDRSCHPFEWERTSNVKIGDSCYDDPYSTINWANIDLNPIGKLEGQEVDICGKTTGLLFNNWTLLIPPTQPLIILVPDGNNGLLTKNIKIKIGNQSISHTIFDGGKKQRAPLRTLKEAVDTFDVTAVDDNGVWIEFNGKKNGIKIPCIPKVITVSKDIKSIYSLVNRKNNLSILFQIINWLWRSDFDYSTNRFPNFIKWWSEHTSIDDSNIFINNPGPKRNCNNYMLPRCSTYQERFNVMIRLWPFYFHKSKIHVSKEMYDRTANFFNVEDIYSRGMTPNDVYGEPGRFIVDLIPTDEDFQNHSSIILSKPEHISNWVSLNNSSIFKYRSLYNTGIIREKIENKLKKMRDYYIYRETMGDNAGQIYIIQNSIVPSQPAELSVLHIANHWKVHESNPGPEYRRNDDNEHIINLKYVLYRIGPQGTLEPAIDKTGGSKDYLQILCYDDGETFASMLPLLVGSNKEE